MKARYFITGYNMGPEEDYDVVQIYGDCDSEEEALEKAKEFFADYKTYELEKHKAECRGACQYVKHEFCTCELRACNKLHEDQYENRVCNGICLPLEEDDIDTKDDHIPGGEQLHFWSNGGVYSDDLVMLMISKVVIHEIPTFSNKKQKLK